LMKGTSQDTDAQTAPLSQPLVAQLSGGPDGVIPVYGAAGPPNNAPFYPLTTNNGSVTFTPSCTGFISENPSELENCVGVFYLRNATTGNWTATTQAINYDSTKGGYAIDFSTITPGYTVDAWSFAISTTQWFSSFVCTFHLYVAPNGSGQQMTIPNVPHHFTVSDWPNLASWPVQSIAFLAGSLLCSFVGSDLENGGDIAIVRCPIGSTPTGLNTSTSIDTGFSSISTVPYAYFGPVKTGAYAWLRPGLNAYRFSPFNNRSFTAGIFVTMNMNSRTASLLLSATLVLAGTCSNGLLTVAPPPIVPGFQEVFEVLNSAPSATENPSHTSTLSKAIKSITNVVTSDAFLDTVSGVGTVASMLGVPGASSVSMAAKGAKKAKKESERSRQM
jgi:hypothetical protein